MHSKTKMLVIHRKTQVSFKPYIYKIIKNSLHIKCLQFLLLNLPIFLNGIHGASFSDIITKVGMLCDVTSSIMVFTLWPNEFSHDEAE